jgi:hypothetical protein
MYGLSMIGVGWAYETVESAMSKQAKLYNQILELPDEDNARAKNIADSAITLWQNDHENGVFELEFCQQVMLQKKCFYAARLLSDQVSWIKQR